MSKSAMEHRVKETFCPFDTPTPKDPAGMIKALKQGLAALCFDRLKDRLAVSEKTLSGVVGIAPRTLARRKREGVFPKEEGERVLRIIRLYQQAVQVLESEDRARRWLTTPIYTLEGSTPLEYADTEPGAEVVRQILTQIEHGVFS